MSVEKIGRLVSSGLVMQALARPEWRVEIDGTAVFPQWRFHWSPAMLTLACLDW